MLELVFEFIITIVVLIGGGYMMCHYPDAEVIKTAGAGAISMVLTYWFTQRSASRGYQNGVAQSQQLPPVEEKKASD